MGDRIVDTPKREKLEWLKTIGIAVGLAILFRMFLFSSYVVDGESMMPTLEDGNLLIINKIEYNITNLERFDVIVFHANDKDDYVKRVIGLPGDHIEYKNDILYVNGKKVLEPFLASYKEKITGKLTKDFTLKKLINQQTIPKGYIFVMGDNRNGSYDSRHFGLISLDQVVGKVNLRYWPFTDIDTKF